MLRQFTLCLALFALLAGLAGCSKVTETEQDSAMRFGKIRVFATQHSPRSVVFLFSDASGWNEDMTQSAQSLAQAGAVVLGVDLPTYLANLKASDDGCHYLISEVEDLSEKIQRQFGFTHYRTPLLAGVGEGGTLAYGALAQSPYVTVAGAVALNPVAVLNTKVPLCPGAPSSSAQDGFTYATAPDLPGVWKYAFSTPTAATLPWAPTEQASTISKWQRWLYGGDLQILTRPLLSATNSDPAGLDDLPLTPLPSATPGDTLAIILSGDGGWRDLDRTIGETLAKGNIAVVGWDTLRYFWQARSAQQVADDLTRVMRGYGKLWNRKRILLIGYSFGADVLPSSYNLLPADLRAKVGLISLLGLSDTADFQFHVEGWLGMESDSTDKTVPELARIDKNLLQCLYGDDDDDEVCTNPVFNGAHRVKLDGGHHFDGDYEALAKIISDQWQKQAGQ